MGDKIIKFPKERSKKARAYLKAESKQILMTLSLVSLLIGVVVINDNVTRDRSAVYVVSDNGTQVKDLNRAIANARPMNLFRDIEWEHELAKKLGQDPSLDERTPASVSRNLSSLDKLRYGPLAGKYSIVNRLFKDDPKILEISYVDSSDVRDKPVFVDAEDFLDQYKDLVAIPYQSFKSASKDNRGETFQLMGADKQPTGAAVFTKDEDGRLISIRFSEFKE